MGCGFPTQLAPHQGATSGILMQVDWACHCRLIAHWCLCVEKQQQQQWIWTEEEWSKEKRMCKLLLMVLTDQNKLSERIFIYCMKIIDNGMYL